MTSAPGGRARIRRPRRPGLPVRRGSRAPSWPPRRRPAPPRRCPCGPAAAARRQLLHPGRAAVVPGDLETGLDQVGGHRRAHDAQPDEPDPRAHDCSFVRPLRRSRGQPGQARLGRAGGLVLQADPAPIPVIFQRGQVAVQIQLTAARLAPAGRVGDLHVRGEVGVRGDRGVDVVAVARQVVQVAKEADVGGARRAGAPDHGHRVVGGAQRIGLGAAHRLYQHGAAEPGHGLRRQPDVLRRQLVLGAWIHAVDPVSVERVEPAYAQSLAEAGHDVDVVAKLPAAGGNRQHAAIRAGQVAGEEVQPGQRHAGLLDRRGERVHLAIGGHRRRERPPELDRPESRGAGCGRAAEQRLLGEQQRAIG